MQDDLLEEDLEWRALHTPSFKSTQIKLFRAWKWPLLPPFLPPAQKPNTIVMDITPRRQQQTEETSVDRKTKLEQTFSAGRARGCWQASEKVV